MGVSLGVRISGLLVVGAVAVAAASFVPEGSSTPDRGGGGTIVIAGPSDGARSRGTDRTPSPRQSPAGEVGEAARPSARPSATHSPARPPSTSPAAPSPSNKLLESPGWLPPGPVSPDADGTPDPSSAYDRLRTPDQCGTVLTVIPRKPADPEWRLLRGLATACLAVQGRGGSWATAAEEYAGLAGRADTCKGRAAYAVLGGLLDFHRRHASATVRLKASPGGTPACAYRVAGVDPGAARPGDTVGIELSGTYFDDAELLRYGSVFIGGKRLEGPPVLRSASGDGLVLSAVLPALDGYPKTVDVVVTYGGLEVRKPNALTVLPPAVLPSPGEVSGPPQGVLPLGPLPAHHPGP